MVDEPTPAEPTPLAQVLAHVSAACRKLSPLIEDSSRPLSERNALDDAWMAMRRVRRELSRFDDR